MKKILNSLQGTPGFLLISNSVWSAAYTDYIDFRVKDLACIQDVL